MGFDQINYNIVDYNLIFNRMEPTEDDALYDSTFLEKPVILDRYKVAATVANGK